MSLCSVFVPISIHVPGSVFIPISIHVPVYFLIFVTLVHFRDFTAQYMPRFMRTRCIKARGGNFVIKLNFYASVVIITEAYSAKKFDHHVDL